MGIYFKEDLNPYLYLSFGTGLTTDWANHVAAVHPQFVVIDAQDALAPRPHVYVVIAIITHAL